MKTLLSILLTLGLALCVAATLRAQEPKLDASRNLKQQAATSTATNTDRSVAPEATRRRAQLNMALQTMREAFQVYQEAGILKPEDSRLVAEAIRTLEDNLKKTTADLPITLTSGQGPAPTKKLPCSPVAPTDFCLSVPAHNETSVPQELTVSWTEPQNTVSKYHLQVSEDADFATLIIDKDVNPSDDVAAGEYSVKKRDKLQSGKQYHWRVRADFTDGTQAWAQNGVFRFVTYFSPFKALEDKGLKLQKALTGPDKGELAEFGFLSTIGEKTVYSANFALSWHPTTTKNIGFTNIRPSLSVEGNLASDDSESEDAWRFRGGAIFLTSFVRCKNGGKNCGGDQQTSPTIRDWHNKVSVKLEGDKNFDVKKLSAEFLTTVNSLDLAIGAARPGASNKPLQFQWRPFFGLDVGHTFRPGTSEEKSNTILRLVPRVRARIDLQFLRQALNMNEVAIFADDTFWYLPLENGRKRNNFFTSGIEFNFTSNLGFGVTYKNGRSAPNFQKINTLQGIIGIRFGK